MGILQILRSLVVRLHHPSGIGGGFQLLQQLCQRSVQLESADGGVGQLESDNCNTASSRSLDLRILAVSSLNLLVSCSMS